MMDLFTLQMVLFNLDAPEFKPLKRDIGVINENIRALQVLATKSAKTRPEFNRKEMAVSLYEGSALIIKMT